MRNRSNVDMDVLHSTLRLRNNHYINFLQGADMISIVSDCYLNPSIELMLTQRQQIAACMTMICNEVANYSKNSGLIQNLIEQLKQLCVMHFMYEEKLFAELDYSLMNEHSLASRAFIENLDRIEFEYNKIEPYSLLRELLLLRLNFTSNMTSMSMLLLSYLKSNDNAQITPYAL